MKRILGPKPDDEETQSGSPTSTPSPAAAEKPLTERRTPREKQTIPPEFMEILLPSLKVGATAGMVLESSPFIVPIAVLGPNICQAHAVSSQERRPALFDLHLPSSSQSSPEDSGLPWAPATMVSALYLGEIGIDRILTHHSGSSGWLETFRTRRSYSGRQSEGEHRGRRCCRIPWRLAQ